jgi:Protein of unknown function (DUF2795)
MTDTQRTAELQVLLEGVPLPAKKQELTDYASRQSGGSDFLPDLRALPDHEYRSLDDVGEALLRVQPSPKDQARSVPDEESGQPPGGDEYTNPSPEPGAIRPDWPEDHPPQKTIKKQSEQQKTQKQRQEEQL